ncbi:bacteriocin immunity protein [Dellaglioa sp. P0083]|uniref:bacteriocin immunity protein n=1 Tax=Dellaglioa kimchii TaxID=3344667 RepID=UPI0038D48DF9
MNKLKWFSGGDDRGKQAEQIITDLLTDLSTNNGNNTLKVTLQAYLEELKQKRSSVPFILSRMNLDLSKAIKNDEQPLSDNQSKKLKELTSISNIRYGY